MALAKCSLWWPSHVCSSVGPGMVRSCGGPRMCSRVVNLACVRVWWPWHGVLVCCGALVWWTCHVFSCGGPGMVFLCGSHSGPTGGSQGPFGGQSGAIRGHSGAFRGYLAAVRGHSGVRGHVVSRQGPLGGQSGNRGYAPDTHTMYVYLIAHSLQPIPHTRCPMSPYHILDAHCLIPDTLIPLCPMTHTRYWFLFHTPSHMT